MVIFSEVADKPEIRSELFEGPCRAVSPYSQLKSFVLLVK